MCPMDRLWKVRSDVLYPVALIRAIFAVRHVISKNVAINAIS